MNLKKGVGIDHCNNKLILQYLKTRHYKYYTLYNHYLLFIVYSDTVLNRSIPQPSPVHDSIKITIENISK